VLDSEGLEELDVKGKVKKGRSIWSIGWLWLNRPWSTYINRGGGLILVENLSKVRPPSFPWDRRRLGSKRKDLAWFENQPKLVFSAPSKNQPCLGPKIGLGQFLNRPGPGFADFCEFGPNLILSLCV
jgi:hypothetical protein